MVQVGLRSHRSRESAFHDNPQLLMVTKRREKFGRGERI